MAKTAFTLYFRCLRGEDTAFALHSTAFEAKTLAFLAALQQPWFFLQAYFHVHTPLFTNRSNAGRSKVSQTHISRVLFV